MLFYMSGNYTPEALQGMKKGINADRHAAITNLVEKAGGKVVGLWFTIDEGPGAMVVIDAEPQAMMAMVATIASTGTLTNNRVRRLATQAEIQEIRAIRAQLDGSFAGAGQAPAEATTAAE